LWLFGTFCVFGDAVSVRMGKDRIKDHGANHALERYFEKEEK
jgi:hypothetical protein